MKKIVFTFGRFNPITIGHGKLINKVISLANKEQCEHRIYPSHSEGNKRNPILFHEKLKFLKEMFRDANIISDKNVNSPFEICRVLSKEGFDDVTMIVGSDRIDEFQRISEYIKSKTDDDFNNNKHFNFKNFQIISAGDRNKDMPDISGTKLRQLAEQNDFTTFLKYIPTKNITLAKKMFDSTKRNGLNEDILGVIPTSRINIPRGKMPQVLSKDVPEFLNWLKNSHEVSSKKTKINVNKLKPSQSNFNKDKINKLISNWSKLPEKPILVSSDNFVIDGHHHFAAQLNIDSKGKILVYQIGTNIKEIIKLMHNFSKSFTKTINEQQLDEGLFDAGIFKAVFLAGGPGSGKDFILDKLITGTGLVELNSDTAFENLLKSPV